MTNQEPNLSQERASMPQHNIPLLLYPRGDNLNTQIARAMEVAKKVSQNNQSILNEVEAYQRNLLRESSHRELL